MDILLYNLLASLIAKHERIALPNLGAFYNNTKTKKISFNKFDSWNDKRLEYLYAVKSGKTSKEAEEAIINFTNEIKHELELNKKCVLPQIGTLVVEIDDSITLVDCNIISEIIISKQDEKESQDYNTGFFQLGEHMKKLNPLDNSENTNPLNSDDMRQKRVSFHKWIVVILIVLIGVLLYLTLKARKLGPQEEEFLLNPSKKTLEDKFDATNIDISALEDDMMMLEEPVEEPAPVIVPKNKTTKPSPTKVKGGKGFYVIVASKTSEQDAKGAQRILQKKGITCNVLESQGKYRITAGQYSSRAEAETRRNKVSIQIPDAWILEIP